MARRLGRELRDPFFDGEDALHALPELGRQRHEAANGSDEVWKSPRGNHRLPERYIEGNVDFYLKVRVGAEDGRLSRSP
jgi:hypothetical protein